MFFKKLRVENDDVLEKYRNAPCVICKDPSDPAHIKSKGSGGPDADFNLIPFCRLHHVEQHAKGFIHMSQKYPEVWSYLRRRSWYIDDDKLKNPALEVKAKL